MKRNATRWVIITHRGKILWGVTHNSSSSLLHLAYPYRPNYLVVFLGARSGIGAAVKRLKRTRSEFDPREGLKFFSATLKHPRS